MHSSVKTATAALVALFSPSVALAGGENDSALHEPGIGAECDRFDLAQYRAGERLVSEAEASFDDPVVPRGADLRDLAWDAPLVEVQMGDGGPALQAGALGAKRKGAPKLAHVLVAWDF